MTPTNSIVLFLFLILACPSYATLHPVLISPRISSCQQPACAASVVYDWGTSTLVDIFEASKPDPSLGTELVAMGMHCNVGSMLTGTPFSGCLFTRRVGHNPTLLNCRLRSTDSWELTSDSTCNVRNDGPGNDKHSGAGPGGECVVFVQAKSPTNVGTLLTIHGLLESNNVANSGNRFCQKPIPPAVQCEVTLPAVIDHGVMGPKGASSVSVNGEIRCGAKPVVTFASGNTLTLAPGVTTQLYSKLVGERQIQITSDLKTNNAAPGAHSASTVVVVSPY